MPVLTTDVERIHHLQWRLKRLEDFVGHSKENNINEAIRSLNDDVFRYASNNLNARMLVKRADEIKCLTGSTFQRSLMADAATKLELILADEARIRAITEILSQIDALVSVLDEQSFQDMPKLFKSLSELLLVHDALKNRYHEFNREHTSFLQDYAAFILMMDSNLQQYKSVVSKNSQATPSIEDCPVE